MSFTDKEIREEHQRETNSLPEAERLSPSEKRALVPDESNYHHHLLVQGCDKQFNDWGITRQERDHYTVSLDRGHHLSELHGRYDVPKDGENRHGGGLCNDRWREFFDSHPDGHELPGTQRRELIYNQVKSDIKFWGLEQYDVHQYHDVHQRNDLERLRQIADNTPPPSATAGDAAAKTGVDTPPPASNTAAGSTAAAG